MHADVYDLAPKVELHLHLEGATPLQTLWTIIEDNGGDPTVPDAEALRRRFEYRDFAHFIDTWAWMIRYLRSTDDFTLLAETVARDLARQSIVYAEASFSPTDFSQHGLTPQELALAIRRGLDLVPEVQVVLNCDLVRDTGPERAERTLEAVLEVAAEADVRGITIGGSEQLFPPEQFAPVYRRAAEVGMRRTVHAGEAAGPESVWGAMRALGVERIGHGIRAVEDAALVEHLVEHRIPLEVCPTSNLRTGVARSWSEHQVLTLLAAGALVTISSDDPTLFQCDLSGEMRMLVRQVGDGPGLMHRLTRDAVDASWMTADEQQATRRRVDEWWSTHEEAVTASPAESPPS